MEENTKKTPISQDNDNINIFDDFSPDENLAGEIEEIEKDKNKNVFFYLEKVAVFFKYINVVFFLFTIV